MKMDALSNTHDHLEEVLEELIQSGNTEKASTVLEMVKCTYHRYDEFKEKLERALAEET